MMPSFRRFHTSRWPLLDRILDMPLVLPNDLGFRVLWTETPHWAQAQATPVRAGRGDRRDVRANKQFLGRRSGKGARSHIAGYPIRDGAIAI